MIILVVMLKGWFTKEERVNWVQSTWGFMKQMLPLLTGPSLSLPNMLVIGGVMGVKKIATFCIIIVVLSAVAGMSYGWMAG